MELMMEAMKVKLSACGIGETSDVHNKDPISANQDAMVEATSALAFLEASGVPYFVRLKVVQVHIAVLFLRHLVPPPHPEPQLPGTICQAEYYLIGSPQDAYPGSLTGSAAPLTISTLGGIGPNIECLNWSKYKVWHITAWISVRPIYYALSFECQPQLFLILACLLVNAPGTQPVLPPMVILHDGSGCVPPGLREAGQQVRGRGVFAVELPQAPSGTRRYLPAMPEQLQLSGCSQLGCPPLDLNSLKHAGWMGRTGLSLSKLAATYADALTAEFGTAGEFILCGK